MTLVRLVARPMLASVFVVYGVQTLRNPEPLVPRAQQFADKLRPQIERVAPKLPTDPASLVRLNGALHVAAGLALATGRFPRLSSLVLAGTMLPTTVAGHAYWQVDDPAERAQQRIHFFKNLALGGGLLIAGVDTEGKPGLSWRARRAAKDAKRAARTARREARLATRAARADARRAAHELVH